MRLDKSMHLYEWARGWCLSMQGATAAFVADCEQLDLLASCGGPPPRFTTPDPIQAIMGGHKAFELGKHYKQKLVRYAPTPSIIYSL